MTDEERQTIRDTITILDKKMQKAPNRELADVSNYLENLLANE